MPQDTYVTPTIQASGTTWAQLKTGGLDEVLALQATTNAAKANPTVAATNGQTVSAGGLAAGTYFAAYTWVDAWGETTIGTSEVTFTTTGTAQLNTLTIPALPTGVQSANIYLTAVGGASGSETLYATGITTTTFGLAYTPITDQPGAAVPAANTTGWLWAVQQLTEGANMEQLAAAAREWLSQYLRGYPVTRRDIVAQLIKIIGNYKALYTAWNEIGTLVAANMPTGVTVTTDPRGMPVYRWTLP